MSRYKTSFLTLILLFILSACNLAEDPVPVIAQGHTSTPQPLPEPTATQPYGWQFVTDGLSQQTISPDGNPIAQMQALRIDPAQYTFRVHYRPGETLTIQEWRDALPDAIAIVNANFFSRAYTIQGLLISDGVRHGQSYVNRGGTFAIQNGMPRITSNIAEPYAGQAYEQAVQAFPMLVINRAQAYTRSRDTRPSRRTVIAQDADGQIILMTTSLLGLGLYNLSDYLARSDLNLVNAFNLDGGGSTMMYIQPMNYTLSSFDPVPAVLAVYLR
ncbi:MAG: phosphodiester glycosidase family protein, partial [Aggregatilineales bacterium]